MKFIEINMSDDDTKMKVIAFMDIIRRIGQAPNHQLPLTVVDIDSRVGTGQLGKLLRTVLQKVKGASTQGDHTFGCVYEVDKAALAQLVRVIKRSTQYELEDLDSHADVMAELEKGRAEIRAQKLAEEEQRRKDMEEFLRWKQSQSAAQSAQI